MTSPRHRIQIRACQAGHRVLYATAAQWVDRLGHATAAETLDTYESSWHQLREPASSMIAFSATRSLAVARRIARPTKGAVSDPNPPGDPVLRKVIKVPPSTASQI